MAASAGVRVLAAAAMVATLGLGYQSSANAGRPDQEVVTDIVNGMPSNNLATTGKDDRILPIYSLKQVPSGFQNSGFNDSAWFPDTVSPCLDTAWAVPDGATTWSWAPDCFLFPAILLRRTFSIHARDVLDARLSVALHGDGVIYVNGKSLGEVAGNPSILDVTGLLHGNGRQNVLAYLAVPTSSDDGLGIAYNLHLTLSGSQVDSYNQAHRVHPKPTAIPVGPSSTPVPGGTPPAPGPGVCAGNSLDPAIANVVNPALPAVVPIFTQQLTDKPTSTAWVTGSSAQASFLVTRLVDIDKIVSPNDMPSAQIGGKIVRASGIATDDASGVQVLILPPVAQGSLPRGALTQTIQPNTTTEVIGYSRSLGCMAVYTAITNQNIQVASGTRFVQLNSLPFADGVDGGVVYDTSGRFLGVAAFGTSVTDTQNQVISLVLPSSTAAHIVDQLSGAVTKQAPPGPGQHVVTLSPSSNGTQKVVRIDGAAAGSPTPTPAIAGVPVASPTP